MTSRAAQSFEFTAPLDFPRTLAYIGRYEIAQREAVADGIVYQVLSDDAGYFLARIRALGPQRIAVEQVSGRGSSRREEILAKFARRSFGSDEQLLKFYRMAKRDPVLGKLARRFRGVRVVGVWDLWECLGWSILGQQVSVHSAFAMRARLARLSRAIAPWNGVDFEGFPRVRDLLVLTGDDLRACGLSQGKMEYLRSIAGEILDGRLSEEALLTQSFDEARARLLALRGIGPWSAEYCMMRVVGDPDACPVEDIGVRNAIGKEYGLERQATLAETREISSNWAPYRAYGTFYLWQTLW